MGNSIGTMAGCPCDLWRESRNGRTYRFFLVLLGMPCGRWKLSRTLLFLFLLFFRPFFFFLLFFPHGSSPRGPYRSPPLSGILTVSIGTGWCERGSLDRWRTYPSFSALLPFFVFQLPLLCGFPVFLVFCSIFSRLLARLFRSDFFLRFFYR